MRQLTPQQVWQGRTYAFLATCAGGFVAFDPYLSFHGWWGLIPFFGSSFVWMWWRGGLRYAGRQYVRTVIGTMILWDIDQAWRRLEGRDRRW